tara:strand:- start:728 stop:1012 length:285 start_codon:yes stop_codon:yes gene_type:complete
MKNKQCDECQSTNIGFVNNDWLCLDCGEKIDHQIKEKMNLTVKIKNVYGIPRIYPVCEKAELFARISGNKTLLPIDIELIKKLGYKLTTESEAI